MQGTKGTVSRRLFNRHDCVWNEAPLAAAERMRAEMSLILRRMNTVPPAPSYHISSISPCVSVSNLAVAHRSPMIDTWIMATEVRRSCTK